MMPLPKATSPSVITSALLAAGLAGAGCDSPKDQSVKEVDQEEVVSLQENARKQTVIEQAIAEAEKRQIDAEEKIKQAKLKITGFLEQNPLELVSYHKRGYYAKELKRVDESLSQIEEKSTKITSKYHPSKDQIARLAQLKIEKEQLEELHQELESGLSATIEYEQKITKLINEFNGLMKDRTAAEAERGDAIKEIEALMKSSVDSVEP